MNAAGSSLQIPVGLNVGIPLVLLLLLCGCIRYEEHVEIDENGKGSATIVMSRPVRDLIDKIRSHDFDSRFSKEAMEKDLPSSVHAEHRETEENNRVEIRTVYTFDDINTLIGWAARSGSPLDNISVTRTKESIAFTRRFRPDKSALENAQKYCPDAKISFKLTGPGSIQTNNATRVEGNTAFWEYNAPELFDNGGKNLAAAYYFGTPKWVYAASAAGVLLAVIAIFVILKRTGKVRGS